MPHTPEFWVLNEQSEPLPTYSARFCVTADVMSGGHRVIATVVDCLISEEECRANAELLVRAPRLARVLKQLHYELSPFQPPPENAELSFAWRQACALVAELEKAGVL